MVTQNPNLIPPKQMEASMSTSTSSKPLFSEIFTKVHNAKVKAKKIEVLKSYDTPGLRRILKGAFDPRIVWELPPGTPPYMANEAPAGTQHTYLESESSKLWHFIRGGDDKLNRVRKETLFIQVLEGLHKDEAEVLIGVKEKKLNNMYKGLSESVVKEAFDWDDNFMQKENK